MKHIQRPAIYLVLIILISCIACKKKEERKGLLPKVTGKPGEILLVMDPYIWESPVGRFFRETFNEPYEPLPADEPIYDLVQIPWSGFTRLFKSHRNIFLAKISDEKEEPRIIVQKDLWATPQLLVNIVGSNDSSLIAYLEQNRERLIGLLNQNEISRTIGNYRSNMAKGINEILKEHHQISITVPAGYSLDVDSSNFVWISHELADLIQGILIYHYPYTDPATFTKEYLIAKRNAFTRKYVPGPVEGSYMTIEPTYPVNFSENVKNGQYMAELRGLWRTNRAFMGGPFISHTILDEKRNRVVTVEGFVYAPGLNKRNYMRELEAILQTAEIID